MHECPAEGWVGSGLAGGSVKTDADGLRDALDACCASMSDARFEVEDVHVSQDVVTMICPARGTHTGGSLGVAPAGRAIDFMVIAVHRVEEGRIVE